MANSMNVIDLFAGVGGLSLGFERAGFNVVLANEIDAEIADSYRHNHKNTIMVTDDIRHFIEHFDEVIETNTNADNREIVSRLLGSIDVIIGGPPCQGFSMAGERIRKTKEFVDDPRNFLFKYYFKFIQKFEPEYFVFENVEGILSIKNGSIIDTIKQIFRDGRNFKNGGYYVNLKVFNAYEFGVPQLRKRVIIMGSKKPFDFDTVIDKTIKSLEKPLRAKFTARNVVRDAIFDLRDEPFYHQGGLSNHVPTKHNSLAIERMKKIKPNQNRLVLDEDIHSVHSGSYGRLSWDNPATTITTRFDTPSGGRYIHPDFNRTITPREAARIQTFPDDFEFLGSKSSICTQIGNAVPPLLAEFIAYVILTLNTEQNVK